VCVCVCVCVSLVNAVVERQFEGDVNTMPVHGTNETLEVKIGMNLLKIVQLV